MGGNTHLSDTGLRFFIVDDYAPTREVLCDMIAVHNGWEVVHQASHGLEATLMVNVYHPDVIIMDVAMPEMNGIQATRYIKSIAPNTKIILFSAHEDPVYLQASRDVGADMFVKKEDLSAKVLRQLVTQIYQGGTDDVITTGGS